MKKSTARKWMGATMVAVMLALFAACAHLPAYPIQDKIERDASDALRVPMVASAPR